jgi:PAS domain S-box-containing protein
MADDANRAIADVAPTDSNDVLLALERAQFAQASVGVGIHDHDVAAGTIHWDAVTRAVWGVDADAVITPELIGNAVHRRDADRVAAAVAAAQDPAGDGRLAITYRIIRQRDRAIRTIAASGQTYFADGAPVRVLGTVRDVTEQHFLSESARLITAFADRANDMFWLADAETGRIVYANTRLAETLGQTHAEVLQLHMPLDPAHDLDSVRKIIRRMQPGESLRPVISSYPAADGTTRAVEVTIVKVRYSGHDYAGMIGRDVTPQQEMERHRELLIHELNHRVKNVLVTVQSITAQTLRGHVDIPTLDRLDERLHALARSHDLLTSESWEGAEMAAVIRQSLAAHLTDPPRIRFGGPTVNLRPGIALALSMAFHELATNAMKYGALSTDKGMVDLSWTVNSEGEGNASQSVVIRWQEAGGPPVPPRTRTGFGTRLLEQGLAHEIGGTVRLDLAADGLICTMTMPHGDAT